MIKRSLFFVLLSVACLLGCHPESADNHDDRIDPLLTGGNIPQAQEEGWTSGGADPIGDALNPWWMKNSHTIHYCIRKSLEFSDIPTPVEQLAEMALAFWKTEFEDANKNLENPNNKVGTQQFIYGKCQKDTDLVIQFGVLDEKQKKFLRSPRELIAVAVRTDYDRELLRAKGFIYVSPDRGELGYNTEKGLIPNAWHLGEGGLLYHTLRHELGHVFGIPHNPAKPLMAKDFMDKILREDQYRLFTSVDARAFPYFRFLGDNSLRCSQYLPSQKLVNLQTKFFGLPEDWGCIKIELNNEATELSVSISSGIADEEFVLVGRASFETSGIRSMFASPIVQIRLTPVQKVFSQEVFWPFLNGPGFVKYNRKGTYQTLDGSIQRPITLNVDIRDKASTLSLYDIRYGGVLDGKIFIDIEQGY